MLYTKSHVRALEAQIDYLKAELKESRSREQALLNRLERSLSEEKAESLTLLDRLLAKNNIEQVSPSAVKPVEPVQLITPFAQVNTPELAEAYKQSVIDEETAYLMNRDIAADQAREIAEKRYAAGRIP